MDARKAVIGPLAGFRRRRCPIARRRTGAGLPVKVQLVRKSWRASCGGPGQPSEKYEPTRTCRGTSQNAFGKKDLAMELPGMIRRASDSQCRKILVPSQSVISEIKMASILRTTPCPESPTRGLRVAASDSRNRRASVKVRSVEKSSAWLCGVGQQQRKDALCPVKL